MSTNDIKLVIYISLLIIVLYLILGLFKSGNAAYAAVYYNNELIEKYDLNINKEYKVDGYNGKIEIEVKDKKIRVIEETSRLHLCSYQGFISKPNDIIVCLPNKIIIKILSNKETHDSIAR